MAAATFTGLLALGVAILLPLAAGRTGRARDVLLAAGFAALVLIVSGLLASRGALGDFSKTPPPMLRLLLVTTLSTIALGLSPLGARLARAVPLWALVGYQSFRILVEALLFVLHRGGWIPVQMTFEGYNFDILSGVLALVVAVFLRKGLSLRWVWAWNIFGLATLLNIVIIAVLSMPTPLRAFHAGQPNTLVTGFPFIWIPCVLVQAALLGHILTFRALQRREA